MRQHLIHRFYALRLRMGMYVYKGWFVNIWHSVDDFSVTGILNDRGTFPACHPHRYLFHLDVGPVWCTEIFREKVKDANTFCLPGFSKTTALSEKTCLHTLLINRFGYAKRVATYTSRILSPFEIPALSAAPPGKTALTCCSGAYSCPLMLRSWPPSLTCPRTLKP